MIMSGNTGSPEIASHSARKFSAYFYGLDENAKKRYLQKLDSVSKNIDHPYTISCQLLAVSSILPNIKYPDIYNFLIETPSVYTREDLKAYKSLDAYKYLLAGLVGEVSTMTVVKK